MLGISLRKGRVTVGQSKHRRLIGGVAYGEIADIL